MGDDLEHKRFPWAQTGFDIEGIAAALAAWLVGILLGMLWGPLFWVGFGAAVILLLATRWSKRTAPGSDAAIVAPCDGIVVSIERDTPPPELRMTASDATRIRISSSPATTNRLYAPLSGDIASMIVEMGEPGMALAWRPGEQGLTIAYVTLDGEHGEAGLVVSAGGLGPRIDIDTEAGDSVKVARRVGKRRLGGWCDLYLPTSSQVLVRPGQTLLGGETLISAAQLHRAVKPIEDEDTDAPEDDVFEASEPDYETEADADAAELFERLRKAAQDQS